MSTTGWVVLVVVLVAALAVVAAYLVSRRRRMRRGEELRERFGPEYDRTVAEHGRGKGERELADIADQRERVDIRRLRPGERERYAADWGLLQVRFVDDPTGTVDRADGLVTEVMRARGYPVGEEFRLRAGMLAADHADVVQAYREAHHVRERARTGGDVGTEPLREALVTYRTVFDLLLRDEPEPGAEGEEHRVGEQYRRVEERDRGEPGGRPS